MKSSRKKSDTKGKGKEIDGGRKKTNAIRIEHLNYKVCLVKPFGRAHMYHTRNSASRLG
jgi:hypothetical protein